MREFSYAAAFTRNIGWLTEWEQDALRGKRVAVAGLGGVGGAHLLTLSRLGVGGFNLAEFDSFDLINFNRQVGATMASIGRPKLDVMVEMARAINPGLLIETFPNGVCPENLDRFLGGIDLFVDGLDFFELRIRRLVFRRCAELGVPAITAAPIGMGTNWLIFVPGGMTFEQYFRLEGQPEAEQYLRFLIGLAPRGVHRKYLVDPSRVDLQRKTGPSTGTSCQLCAGVVGAEAVKLLLGRNNLRPAPVHHHFDPYAGTYRQSVLRWGVAGPVQRIKLGVARRFYLRQLASDSPTTRADAPETPMAQILDRARWAPSGDNAQPWRFEIRDENAIVVHFQNESGSNPYEYRDGQPSLLSLGMLIETIRLAASAHGRAMEYEVEQAPDGSLSAQISLPYASLTPDPLEAFITSRSVHRRALQRRPLTEGEKISLACALGPELSLRWYETAGERFRIARLGARVTDIRLRAPEFFPVHQRVIDWQNRHSPSGVPAGAIGLNRATLRLMRWSMRSWRRVNWLNRLSGTLAATVQLDLLPGLRSAGFYAIAHAASEQPLCIAATIRAGAAIQRFWLTAEKLGLAIQPATAMLMIAHYGRSATRFTTEPSLNRKAHAVSRSFADIFEDGEERILFLGRIGQRPPCLPGARSIRHPVATLDIKSGKKAPAAAGAFSSAAPD